VADVNPCWEGEDLLSAYFDGELNPDELAAVVTHLDGCEPCIASFHRVKEARAALRLLPQLAPPEGVITGLHPNEDLSAYLDGELTSTETRAITEHLGCCTECRNELLDLDAARAAVRALPRIDVGNTMVGGSELDLDRRWRRRRRAATLAAAGMAAVLALAFALAGGAGSTLIDRDSLLTRHSARTSVESGFSVIPASLSPGGTP
jgi:anti-sigma factor RsiW